MAYDQNSAYEPPRRPYQARPQPPPAPVSHGYNQYSDYASTPFDQRQAQYDQTSYSQEPLQNGGYNQHYQRGIDQGYGSGYEQARSRPPPPPQQQQHENQYRQEHYGEQQDYGNGDRSYDARYQPRAQQQRAPPGQQRGPAPNGRPMHGDPTSQQPQWEQYDQRPAQDQYAPQLPGGYSNGYSNDALSQQAPNTQKRQQPQQPQQPQPPGRSSMEEWKARERAKMKAEARSPETLPFDNAFPVFGDNKKDERPDSKQSERRNGQGSRDQERRPMALEGQRSYGSGENGYQNPASRPDMERRDVYPEPPQNGRHEMSAPQHSQQGRPAYAQAPPPNQVGSPIDQHFDFGLGQDAPHQTNGYHQNHYPQPSSNQQGYAPAEPGQRAMPQSRGPGSVPPIDTSRAQHHQNPVYNNHQPLSPAHVPPRPSTSHGARPQGGHQATVPLAQLQNGTLHDDYASLPSKPFARVENSRPASLGDIYDDYGAEPAPPPKPLQRRPTNREEEIEADMPDFDNVAPARTSHLGKLLPANGPSTSPLPPAVTPAGHPGLPQSSSMPDVRYEQSAQPYPPSDRRFPPAERGPPRHDGYHGGASSVPPQGYAQRPPPGAQDPRLRQGPANNMQPPRAPFAHEPQVRRSLDDGRPLPYRNGPPPPQRFDAQGRPLAPRGPPHGMRGGPNGMHPRGGPNGMPMGRGFPGRPDLDRQGTTWSDPGRTGSAPPSQGPPPNGMGAPLSQQRSAPDRNPPPHNPDALPFHPVPVRPGLLDRGGDPPPSQPPPNRNYNGSHSSPPGQVANGDASHQRQVSTDPFAQPVTHAELERLRAAVDNAPSNMNLALVLVKKLVEASNVLATEGGRADPRTTSKNREKFVMEAHKRLKRLVGGGFPEAQFYLADCYGSGALGLEIDPKEAFKLYQAAAKENHAESAYRTAVCCEMGAEEGGGTSRDYAKAVQWYRRAATLGDGPGMYKLGAILLKGLLGQQRNVVEAVIWLKRGAEKADADNPHALHELAQIYESENTNPEIRSKVVADDSYARQLFEKAAGLGYKHSQFRLGQAWEYGSLGCGIDNRTSIAYYTKAAAQGEHGAELALSGWYLTGAPGILENSDTEAYLWARKAASSEPPLPKAMFAMGYFTENGIGCPQSMEEARKWYSRSACKCP